MKNTNKQELKELIKNKEQAMADSLTKDDFKIIGIYKMKDKPGRDTIAFKIMPDMEGVIIQKIKGETSKIMVAVRMIKQPEYGAVDENGKVTKTIEKKNDKKSKT